MDETCNIKPNPGRIVNIAGGGGQAVVVNERSSEISDQFIDVGNKQRV
jgi:hypothetical protein